VQEMSFATAIFPARAAVMIETDCLALWTHMASPGRVARSPAAADAYLSASRISSRAHLTARGALSKNSKLLIKGLRKAGLPE
jgi:hypothetical protein